MRGITDTAGERLHQALTDVGASEDRCVRFVATANGADLVIGQQQPGDKGFTHKGRLVLVVEPTVAERWGSQTLDYREGSFCFA